MATQYDITGMSSSPTVSTHIRLAELAKVDSSESTDDVINNKINFIRKPPLYYSLSRQLQKKKKNTSEIQRGIGDNSQLSNSSVCYF